MRIGIISDIHGNFVAMNAVLSELERQRVDRIVCLGDIIFGGPQPREVMAQMRELDCPVIMGNTDEFFVHMPTPDPNDVNDRRIMQIIEWTSSQIGAEGMAFLKTLLPRIELPFANGKILLCYHGTPESNTGIILSTTPEDGIKMLLGNYRAAVMAGGHTHIQMLRRFQQSLLINPGSVGMPRERDSNDKQFRPSFSEYAILDADGENLSIELCRTPLDVNAVLASARKSGMPGVEEWAASWKAA